MLWARKENTGCAKKKERIVNIYSTVVETCIRHIVTFMPILSIDDFNWRATTPAVYLLD